MRCGGLYHECFADQTMMILLIIKNKSSSKLQSISETWEKHLDPASGKLFFYNKEKGVTQWNEPPGFSN